jgi:nucleoside 2-deoxyribosyltransferase
MSKNIYLAGPITGLHFNSTVNWRREFANMMDGLDVECFSPMRGKDHLHLLDTIEHSYPDDILACQRAIMTRDRHDCTKATIIVMNLLREATASNKPSLGTVMELGWADLSRIPVVAIMDKENSPYDHPMILEAIGFRVETLEQAVQTAKIILFPA